MRENAERFEGLAETYALYRPGYPAEAFDALVAACHSDRRIAVDVGAGPGTSTLGLRGALSPEWLITAIDPSQDMRRVLGRSFRGDPGVQVQDAAAEALPLPDASAGLVVACSAFHWFDRASFYGEAQRVLAPGGVLALMRNRRMPHPVTTAFDAYIEQHRLGPSTFHQEPTVRELGDLPGFRSPHSRSYTWGQRYDSRRLIDYYLTRSALWSIVRRIGLGQVMEDLTAISAPHGPGPWDITFTTTLKWTVRR